MHLALLARRKDCLGRLTCLGAATRYPLHSGASLWVESIKFARVGSIKFENFRIVAAVMRRCYYAVMHFVDAKRDAAPRLECPGDRRKDLPLAFTVTISLTGCDWRENTTEGTRQFLSRFPDRPRSSRLNRDIIH